MAMSKGQMGWAGGVTLKGKLLVAMVVLGVFTLVLTVAALVPTWQRYRSAEDNLQAVERFRLVLEAAGRISAERGPSNDIMSIDPGSSLAAGERLDVFRKSSDAALDALDQPVGLAIDPGRLPAVLSHVRERLRRARQDVDRVGTTPLSTRRPEDVQAAIRAMISVVDDFQAVVDWHVAAFTTDRPELTAPFLTGRMIGALREYGGRIASQIMGPVATRQPLGSTHLADSNQTMGKLLELRLLLRGQRIMSDGDPLAPELMEEVDRVFFGKGLELVGTTIAEGRISGDYSMSAVELTRLYVPTFQPLERLRTTFLDEVVRSYRRQHDVAFWRLVEIGAITLSTLFVLFLASRLIRIYVLNPLLAARRQIIALAEGGEVDDIRVVSRAPEMYSLFDALELLHSKLEERSEYEARLKTQAEKDGLTGVWNRRALERFGLSRVERGACLMLIDIDHFKSVNDTYGHLMGDAVLKDIAALLQANARPSDIVARFGGEEFAILTPHSDLVAAFGLAEQLRELVQSHVVRLVGTGKEIKVTASIGIAAVQNSGEDGWRQLMSVADEALYCAKRNGRNRSCIFLEGRPFVSSQPRPVNENAQVPPRSYDGKNGFSPKVRR
ncbi:GGDEF domain-containing protein [Rhizobium puerariae]|uniref:diguanylate cyclase n=1 Tax=Rhizobium puerariae TaxID=1585791 RepID=A0ABV6ALK9_9HYPH